MEVLLMKNYLINIDDFYNTWDDKLVWAIKKYCTKQNKSFSEDRIIGAKVILLLLWYGITIENILKIKLRDVSYEGIKGYDITFDDRTLDTFIEYKKMNGLNIEHGDDIVVKEFKQDSFYRTTSTTEITSRTITNAIDQILKVESEDKEVRNLFKPFDIYDNGSYCFVYDKLIENGKKFRRSSLEEYVIQFGIDLSADTALKNYATKFNKYVKYRQKWEQEHPVQDKPEKTDYTEVATEPTRASAEEVKELVENIVKNPISVEQVEIPKTEQENAVDTCLNILNGLRTTMELVSNQIDTIESVLKTLKQ